MPRIKPLNNNNNKKHNKLFIMLELNSINFYSNTRHSWHCKSIGDLGNFFNVLAKSPRVLRL